MPYIDEKMRVQLESSLDLMEKQIITNISDAPIHSVLAYVFFEISKSFIGSDVRYAKINDVVGALECCKMEIFRRLDKIYSGDGSRVMLVFPSSTKDLDEVILDICSNAKKIDGFDSAKAGILNYILTRIFLFADNAYYELNVYHISDIMNFVKCKIYDDIAAPYEDEKIKTNGDVYYVKRKTN